MKSYIFQIFGKDTPFSRIFFVFLPKIYKISIKSYL
nr:MAG TPA: hypothetical protein [Bacteriophage sp.]DAV71183.1 MAG TPA: hypothetical protein [Bacteriophage sp.]